MLDEKACLPIFLFHFISKMFELFSYKPSLPCYKNFWIEGYHKNMKTVSYFWIVCAQTTRSMPVHTLVFLLPYLLSYLPEMLQLSQNIVSIKIWLWLCVWGTLFYSVKVGLSLCPSSSSTPSLVIMSLWVMYVLSSHVGTRRGIPKLFSQTWINESVSNVPGMRSIDISI